MGFLKISGTLVLGTTVMATLPYSNQSLAAIDNEWLMEEIIVTARKREEGLQDAPISISAFTAEDLAYRGVTNIADIAAFTPLSALC